MQLLPHGTQDLPRVAMLGFHRNLETDAKEKPHRSSSLTTKSCCRCGSPRFGLGSDVGPPGVFPLSRS